MSKTVTVLELTTDVKNPKPDRRSKDWNCRPVLKAGTRFIHIVTERKNDWEPTGSLQCFETTYAYEYDTSDISKLVLANSTQVPCKTWREFACVYDCDWSAGMILDVLIKLGRLNALDFKAVAATPEDFV